MNIICLNVVKSTEDATVRLHTSTCSYMSQKIVNCPRRLPSDTSIATKLIDIVYLDTPIGWKNLFESNYELIERISREIGSNECNYAPELKYIFEAYHLTPLSNVRVVILGNNPFDTLNKGSLIDRGLAFSYPKEEPNPSKCAEYIISEIRRQIPSTKFSNYSFVNWALQGVFLPNSSLTMKRDPRITNSINNIHSTIWEQFMKNTLIEIKNSNPDVIFVAWGEKISKIYSSIGIEDFLECGYPMDSFSNDHFIKINEILKENPIEWGN